MVKLGVHELEPSPRTRAPQFECGLRDERSNAIVPDPTETLRHSCPFLKTRGTPAPIVAHSWTPIGFTTATLGA